MCRLIHDILFSIEKPRIESKDYVSYKDSLCMYKVMIGEKVNLLEVIFYYKLQAFKDKFSQKSKKNPIPYGMFFTYIKRYVRVAPSIVTTQLKRITFVKIGIAKNFPEYVKQHIKKKAKNEPMEEPQSMVGQIVGTQDQPVDCKSTTTSQHTKGEHAQPKPELALRLNIANPYSNYPPKEKTNLLNL